MFQALSVKATGYNFFKYPLIEHILRWRGAVKGSCDQDSLNSLAAAVQRYIPFRSFSSNPTFEPIKEGQSQGWGGSPRPSVNTLTRSLSYYSSRPTARISSWEMYIVWCMYGCMAPASSTSWNSIRDGRWWRAGWCVAEQGEGWVGRGRCFRVSC